MRVARLFLFADWPEKYFSGQSEGGISNTSGTRSVRVSAQGLSRCCCKLSLMKIPWFRLAAPGSPRMCLGLRVCNTRAHVVIVILSLLGICKAPKFSMGFLGVSFTYWFRGFFGVSLQVRSIFFVVFVYVLIRTSPSRKYPIPEGGCKAGRDSTLSLSVRSRPFVLFTFSPTREPV